MQHTEFKIYINEKPLILADLSKTSVEEGFEVLEYNGIADTLLPMIESFENGSFEAPGLVIRSSKIEKLYKDFKDYYKVIEAAGGLVFNADKKVLAIYRMGVWDLPKGKIEKGEKNDEAALREVEEETGIKKLSIQRFLGETAHTYFDPRKQRRVLKISFWYEMKTKDNSALTPQTEEDIELALWLDLAALKAKTPIYKNILEVIEKYER